MKKVIVVSDTHRQNEIYFKVLEMHKPDMVFIAAMWRAASTH